MYKRRYARITVGYPTNAFYKGQWLRMHSGFKPGPRSDRMVVTKVTPTYLDVRPFVWWKDYPMRYYPVLIVGLLCLYLIIELFNLFLE